MKKERERRKPVILESQIVVRLLSDTTEKIDLKAKKAKVSRGEWVRRVLDKAVNEEAV